MFPVLLCGGSGTRLWPLSRASTPKQFVDLGFERTLFGQCLERAQQVDVQELFIVANAHYRFFVAAELFERDAQATLILEPVGRNTAPAIALAAHAVLEKNGPGGLLLVLPSDQRILGQNFAKMIAQATPMALDGAIVAFGLKAKEPATGFGYLKQGMALGAGFAKMAGFHEKPALEVARRYLAEGNYFWNSGIYLLRADVYLEELQQWAPKIALQVESSWQKRSVRGRCIYPEERAFAQASADSIDCAVMTKTKRGVIAPFTESFCDVGSWDALYATGPKDPCANVCIGDVLPIDTRNCYLHASDQLLATIDIEDLVVVCTRDCVLISPKRSAQKVKEVVARLQEEGRQEYGLHPRLYREWGTVEVLARSSCCVVKCFCIHVGASLTVQVPAQKTRHWVVVQGTAEVTWGHETRSYGENQSTSLAAGRYGLSNRGEKLLILIEIQAGSSLGDEES